MPIDPEELLPRKKPQIVIGEDISLLSEHELTARIATMESEIERYRDAIKARQASRSAADTFFKR